MAQPSYPVGTLVRATRDCDFPSGPPGTAGIVAIESPELNSIEVLWFNGAKVRLATGLGTRWWVEEITDDTV